jgi:hypothetical protein
MVPIGVMGVIGVMNLIKLGLGVDVCGGWLCIHILFSIMALILYSNLQNSCHSLAVAYYNFGQPTIVLTIEGHHLSLPAV